MVPAPVARGDKNEARRGTEECANDEGGEGGEKETDIEKSLGKTLEDLWGTAEGKSERAEANTQENDHNQKTMQALDRERERERKRKRTKKKRSLSASRRRTCGPYRES